MQGEGGWTQPMADSHGLHITVDTTRASQAAATSKNPLPAVKLTLAGPTTVKGMFQA